MEDKSLQYLDTGIKVGTGLAALAIARGLIKGTRLASKGVYFRAKNVLRGVKYV